MKELEKYPKVKEAFEKWFHLSEKGVDLFEQLSDVYSGSHYQPFELLVALPFSMQFGVWEDFCESNGVNICIWLEYQFRGFNKVWFYGVEINDKPYENHETRAEARQAVFKQSLTILNSKI